jgi:hypothetical protein
MPDDWLSIIAAYLTAPPEQSNSGLALVLVPAILGLIGVIITVAGNGILNRRAAENRAIEDRRLAAEKLAEDKKIAEANLEHEKRVLRLALKGEIQSLVSMANSEIHYLKDHDFTWIPILDFFTVYKNNSARLGLLNDDEVERITAAYYLYLEEIGYIARIGNADPATPIMGSNIGFDFAAEPQKREWITQSLTTVRDTAQLAIDAIKAELPGRDSVNSSREHDAAFMAGSPPVIRGTDAG